MEIQYIFELVGTFFFAISGALALKDKQPDWFAATFTGFLTAIGGGTLRDVLLDSYPLVWVSDTAFLYAILLGVVTTFLFHRVVSGLRKTFMLFDSLGISFFTILGVEKAINLGFQPEVAVIMGMFSGVMGGVIRDTLTNEIPVIFRKEIYATACLIGAGVYLLLAPYILRPWNMAISIGLIVTIRVIAIYTGLSLPKLK